MRPNPQEIGIWPHLLKKSLMENFIFCAVMQYMTVNKETKRVFASSACYRENVLRKLTLCRENAVDINNQCWLGLSLLAS